MCLYPKLIPNPKYRANKKNGYNPPIPKDDRVLFVPIGCGQCMECRKQKARAWQVRLHEEIRTTKLNKYFTTFSFSDESLNKLESKVHKKHKKAINKHNKDRPHDKIKYKKLEGYTLDNAIAKLAVRYYLENWRKEFKKSVRHWFVTELGQKNTERIHIHGIMLTEHDEETIKRKWPYGTTYIGDYVNEKTINYIVKYIYKVEEKHKYFRPIILTSPGIGKGYMDRKDHINNKYKGKNTNTLYKTRSGIKLPLPIYYRNKIYSEEEKEDLWLNLLDEETRYVDGIKISVKDGDETDYWKVVKQIRHKNRILGYGNNEINEDDKEYEQQLRNLKHAQRFAKLNKLK
jgi:hypothetical protein